MKTKDPITKVIFRRDRTKDGEVIALFPADAGAVGEPNTCSAYVHAGQHLSADIAVTVAQTRLAKPAEYHDLQNELERIGYRLLIRRRATSADREERIRQLRA